MCLHTYFVCCCAKHQILDIFCVQFFVASNDLEVLPRILQVELPALVPELVVVQGGEDGVAQAAEDPLGVVPRHQGVGVAAAQRGRQQLRPGMTSED